MVESPRCAKDLADFLKHGPLREFTRRQEPDSGTTAMHSLMLDRHEFPVPQLLVYVLGLAGVQTGGPAEKVAWWALFSYKGVKASVAHAKFGLKLILPKDLDEDERETISVEIRKQLRAAVRAAERMLRAEGPDLLAQGSATVVNQHWSLERAYKYFRTRALDPNHVPDELKVWGDEQRPQGLARSSTFQSGKIVMQLNAFHDMIAAITAFLSRLEHDLVLALAFSDFDPATDDLTAMIRSRWGDKFNRVLGHLRGSSHYRTKLVAMVEHWRNTYSHGGFEKGHRATIYLQVPNVGTVPVGMTEVSESPQFSFMPATESTIEEVFQLFDEIDAWMEVELPEAIQWIESGLDVRFDVEFRKLLRDARERDEFDELLKHFEYRQAIVDNMDY